MNGKKLTLLVILLLILDQALKIWVKTHMTLGEAIILIPDWFQLYFIETKVRPSACTSPRRERWTGASCF